MATDAEPRIRYRLTLEAMRSDVPAAVRFRQLLKVLNRGWFRMRCLDAEEIISTQEVSDGNEDAEPADEDR